LKNKENFTHALTYLCPCVDPHKNPCMCILMYQQYD
jgi:hypothetical protein